MDNQLDAASAYTVKLEDAPRLLRIPKSEFPDVWIRLPRRKWPNSWSDIKNPVVLFERNLYGHPLAGLLWERQFEEVLLELGWEKSTQIGNVYLFIENKTQILLGTLKTRNQPWEEPHVYLEVEYSSPFVGCARNRQEHKSNSETRVQN